MIEILILYNSMIVEGNIRYRVYFLKNKTLRQQIAQKFEITKVKILRQSILKIRFEYRYIFWIKNLKQKTF